MKAMLAVMLTLFFMSTANAETGIGSIYGNGDGLAWGPTASGAKMNPHLKAAAHKTARLGSFMKACNQSNSRCVRVLINDRGPYIRGRIIDFTPAAAAVIGCDGLCKVEVTPD